MTSPLLELRHLRVAYPTRQTASPDPTWAVDDVSFHLQPGEILGLVGESGCGKSTLGRSVLRLLPTTSRVTGEIWFQGQSVLDLTPAALRRFRGEAVSLVFQDPMTRLDPLMTIGAHCLETLRSHRSDLSRSQAQGLALDTLAAVQIPADRWHQYPHEFSGGMRQRVAIALALLLNPKLIVADEPTTSLDVTVAAQILQELTRLCTERQMGLLLISHDLATMAAYCDRLAVMYQGQLVELNSATAVLQQPQHPYTQSLLQAALHLQTEAVQQKAPRDRPSTATPLLKLDRLQTHYTLSAPWWQRLTTATTPGVIKAVDAVSLELYTGEILGLVGESGCGKSTLSRSILRLVTPTGGKVEFAGQDLVTLGRSQLRAQRRHLQMIFQDPHACLNPLMTVGQGVADPLLIHRLATPAIARDQALAMLERVGLTPALTYAQRYPHELSGGQQQRVAIARALITRPQLLICDEPVSMLDASVQAQVLDLMLELKAEFNLTYLFITHDLWVARFLCDRIAVMNQGQIVEIGPTDQLFTEPQHPYTRTLLQAAPLLARTPDR